jgi:prephenate dehydratase
MFKNIHQVFSKSQVFRQSAHWLHNHLPHAKLISVDSTTAGIERLYPWYSGLKAKGEFLPSMLRDFLTSEVAKATLRGKNRETCPSKLTRGRANLSPMGITASRRQAVICSPSAVKLYKLTPLAQNIEDNTNITTFGIIKATQ